MTPRPTDRRTAALMHLFHSKAATMAPRSHRARSGEHTSELLSLMHSSYAVVRCTKNHHDPDVGHFHVPALRRRQICDGYLTRPRLTSTQSGTAPMTTLALD